MPKALLPVAGRPFAEHQLELLAAHGVDGHRLLRRLPRRHDPRRAGRRRRFGVSRATTSTRATELRGTGGALRLVVDQGALGRRLRRALRRLVPARSTAPRCGGLRRQRPPGADDRVPQRRPVGRQQRRPRRPTAWSATRRGSDPRPPGCTYIDYGLSILVRDGSCSSTSHVTTVSDLADLFTDLRRTAACRRLRGPRALLRDRLAGGLADLETMLERRTGAHRR